MVNPGADDSAAKTRRELRAVKTRLTRLGYDAPPALRVDLVDAELQVIDDAAAMIGGLLWQLREASGKMPSVALLQSIAAVAGNACR